MLALQVIGLFVLSVILHEAGHALAAVVQGYRLKKFYVGIPLEFNFIGRRWSTCIVKKQVGGVEFGISLLILGGAVDFYDLEEAPFWPKFWVIMAGPLTNLLLGFVSLLFFYDLFTATRVTVMICSAVVSVLVSLVGGNVPLSQISGPVGMINTMTAFASGYTNGVALLWIILNLAVFVTNVLPIPAIDGGQVLTSAVVALFGKKWKKPMDKLTYFFFYFLMVVMIVMLTKDLW